MKRKTKCKGFYIGVCMTPDGRIKDETPGALEEVRGNGWWETGLVVSKSCVGQEDPRQLGYVAGEVINLICL